MEFELNKTQVLLQQLFRKFAETEIKPYAEEMDETATYRRDLIDKMKKYGFLGTAFPRELGGAGAGYLGYALCVEELSKVDASSGLLISVHNLGGQAIAQFANDEQKKKWVTRLATGEAIGSFGLTEPGAGTDAAGQQTKAWLEGDHYVINGSKMFTTNAQFSDIGIVMAMTNKAAGTKGISAFIVDMHSKGIEVGKNIKRMGIRAASNTEVYYDNVIVPKENLLGKEGDGFKIAMQGLDGGRIGIAAQALGVAEGALNEALKYIKERKQFGKKISSFQNTQFKAAEYQTLVDAAKLLVYRAAWAHDNHKPFGQFAAMAKLYASTIAQTVTSGAVQFLGGYGYQQEYQVERMMRDAKITEIYEGTSEAQKMVISGSMKVF
ncbi:MAG: acyl-CoA dehydrogenase family protein [Spirochaetaceae bacterium]|jgi:butyryl-CoA dehydrogenase|nr:acyl-CoA dehydrogenase family protein [Spirochaetaceae bacterium]